MSKFKNPKTERQSRHTKLSHKISKEYVYYYFYNDYPPKISELKKSSTEVKI